MHISGDPRRGLMVEEDKERQTRKRRRLTWDVAPSGQPEVVDRTFKKFRVRVFWGKRKRP